MVQEKELSGNILRFEILEMTSSSRVNVTQNTPILYIYSPYYNVELVIM